MTTSYSAASRPLARGDVVLVPFPFTDLSATKRRPGVIVGLDPAQDDFLLAFISSQQIMSIALGELAILPTHPEFAGTGLTTPSKVRSGKMATLSRSLFTRWLGHFGPQLLQDLDRALVAALGVNVVPFREDARRQERHRLRGVHEQGGTPALLADLELSPAEPSAFAAGE